METHFMQSAYVLQICDVDKQYGSVCMEMYTYSETFTLYFFFFYNFNVYKILLEGNNLFFQVHLKTIKTHVPFKWPYDPVQK